MSVLEEVLVNVELNQLRMQTRSNIYHAFPFMIVLVGIFNLHGCIAWVN